MKKEVLLRVLILFLLSLLLFSTTVASQEDRIYMLILNYNKESAKPLSLVDFFLAEGTAPAYEAEGDYILEITSDNEILKSIAFSKPAVLTSLPGLTNEDAISADNLNFSIALPYFENAKTIIIYDKKNNKLLEIPTETALKLEHEPEQTEISPSPFDSLVQENLPQQQFQPISQQAKTEEKAKINWVYTLIAFLLILIFFVYIRLKRRKGTH